MSGDLDIIKEAAFKHREDIPQPFDEFIDMDGFDVVCTLCTYFGGSTLYIPNLRSLFKRSMEMAVLDEFDGKNYLPLSRKYGISERTLRKLIREEKKSR